MTAKNNKSRPWLENAQNDHKKIRSRSSYSKKYGIKITKSKLEQEYGNMQSITLWLLQI